MELESELLTARATVSATTDLAPASLNARAQASKVAPVVNTSSTSRTRRLSTWLLGVWQKRHALTLSALRGWEYTCQDRPACASAAQLCAATASAFQGAWKSGQLGCTHAVVRAAGGAARARRHRRRAYLRRVVQAPPVALQTKRPESRFARTSAEESPERAGHDRWRSCARNQRHRFCPRTRDRSEEH